MRTAHQKRQPPEQHDPDPRRAGEPGGYRPVPLADVLRLAEKRRRLEAQRAELSAETDRVVLDLVEHQGINQPQLAHLLGISEQRASQLVQAAKKRRDRDQFPE